MQQSKLTALISARLFACGDRCRELRAASLLAICLLSVLISGCSRAFYRRQADEDSYNAILERLNDPRWQVPRFNLSPSPFSRIADPYDPDNTPLPPDDPAAHRYMHVLNGMKGYRSWHKLGQSFVIENPHWLEPYGLPADLTANHPPGLRPLPVLKDLTLQDTVELASMHSREYQTQIEDVYLSALALTFERFQFGVRYLGLAGVPPLIDFEQESRPDVRDSVEMNARFGISQMLPTGGQWILEMANNTLWIFTSGDTMATSSVISYSITQPLWRGAGRKVVLESLTQSERDVLYETRDLARFRRVFFTDIAGAGPSGGFLGLLLLQQTVRNERDNVERVTDQVEERRIRLQFQRRAAAPLAALPPNLNFALPALRGQLTWEEGTQRLVWDGPITEAQIAAVRDLSNDPAYQAAAEELLDQLEIQLQDLSLAQLETRLSNSRNRLIVAERQLQDSLDQFKLQLGLPPDLQMTIDESLVAQFELIELELQGVERELKELVEDWAELDETHPDPAEIRRLYDRLNQLADEVRRVGIDLSRDDIARAEQDRSRRLERLRKLEATQPGSDYVIKYREAEETDKRLFQENERQFIAASAAIQTMVQLLQQPNLPKARLQQAASQFDRLRREVRKVAQGLFRVQVGRRVQLIRLQPFEMSIEEAMSNGVMERLDLMNQKAQVMDARRLVEVRANALEGVLDIRAEGDLRTRGTAAGNGIRPLEFRGSESSFRSGVTISTPLDQVAQRNEYRAALIDYQRARRDYIAAEDTVKQQIRNSWRQLQALQQNFEVAREALRTAALQFDLLVEEADDPARTDSDNQGLNLLNALGSVLDAQNDLIQIWVNYERSRLNIYRDMGMMEIDQRGVWVDDLYQQTEPPDSDVDTDDTPGQGPIIPPAPLATDQPPASHLLNQSPEIARPGDAGLFFQTDHTPEDSPEPPFRFAVETSAATGSTTLSGPAPEPHEAVRPVGTEADDERFQLPIRHHEADADIRPGHRRSDDGRRDAAHP